MSAEGAGQDTTRKHLAAFLGAPVGSAVLAMVVWLLFSEPCPTGPFTIDCIPVGGVRFGIEQVAMGATVVAVLGALAIEI